MQIIFEIYTEQIMSR